MRDFFKPCWTVGCLFFLSGCMNPYENYTSRDLAKISIRDLCYSAQHYKNSDAVNQEIAKRGYIDCSESELYCQDSLGLRPSTQAYVNCRLQRDQHDLQEKQMYLNYMEATQPQQFDVNVYHHN